MANFLKQVRTLQKLRHIREDKKERALQQRKHQEDDAKKHYDHAQEERRTWQRDMPAKEDALFADIQGQKLTKRDWQAWQNHQHRLKEHEQELIGHENAAEQSHQQAQEETQKARELYRKARKQRNKTDELATDIQKEETIQLHRREDDELDEFATTRFQRKDS